MTGWRIDLNEEKQNLTHASLEEEAEQDAKDYCMCGERMDTHSVYNNHSPVSVYDYTKSQESVDHEPK